MAESNASRMAADEINEKGGILGRRLELILQDTASDYVRTASAFEHLAHVEKVPLILGPNWVEFGAVAGPLANQTSTILLEASGLQFNDAPKDDFIFTLRPPLDTEIAPLGRAILAFRPKRLGVIRGEIVYHETTYAALSRTLKDNNINPVVDLQFPEGNNDFRSAIVRLKEARCDALLMLLTFSGGQAKFLRELKGAHFSIPIFSSTDIGFDQEVQHDKSLAEGATYLEYKVFDAGRFREKYEQRFKDSPFPWSAQAYDSIYVLKRAIEICNGEIEVAKLRGCLKKVKLDGVTGHIEFNEAGMLKEPPEVTTLFQIDHGIATAIP